MNIAEEIGLPEARIRGSGTGIRSETRIRDMDGFMNIPDGVEDRMEKMRPVHYWRPSEKGW